MRTDRSSNSTQSTANQTHLHGRSEVGRFHHALFIAIRLLRPAQWTKNVVVLAGLVFGRQIDEPGAIWNTALAIVSFCLASSAGYIVNDLIDRDRDRLHPAKRHRPIASGEVSSGQAVSLAAGLLAISAVIAFGVSGWLLIVVLAYVMTSLVYSMVLKHVVILDVVTIGVGFVLRAVAGAVAVGTPASPWLLGCTFLLAVFIGFGKRKNELVVLGTEANRHRPTLSGYRGFMVDALFVVSAALTILSYVMYTLTADDVPGNYAMTLTVPFVVAAIARYLYLVYSRNLGGAPETMLFKDRVLLGTIVTWSVTVMLVIAMS